MKIYINKNIKIENIYSFFIGLLIFTFTLNNLSIGSIKMFYLIIPIILSYFIFKYKEIKLYTENRIFILFCALSFLTLAIVTFKGDYNITKHIISSNLKILCIALICIVMSNIIDFKSIKIFSNISIIITCILSFDFFINFDGYRYQGFFNDPNYFNSAILLLIFINIIELNNNICNLKKIILMISIILLTFLQIATASRSGIFGILVFWLFILKYSKDKKGIICLCTYLGVIVTVIYICYDANLFNIQHTVKYLIERILMKSNNDYGSAMMRFSEMYNGLNIIAIYPLALFIGIGTGSTTMVKWFSKFAVNDDYITRIHNTYVSVLIENGILSLIVFIMLIIFILRLLTKSKNEYKYIYFSLLSSQLIMSGFIWTIDFIPFWISIYIICKLSRIKK